MHTPGWFRFALLACSVLACPTAGAGNDSGITPVNQVAVEMPPYEIRTDRILPPPESWLYVMVPAGELTRGNKVVVAPGYEMLSSFSEKNTRVFVEQVQRRQLVGTILWPVLMEAMPRRPMVVIFDRRSQPRMSREKTDDAAWESDPIAAVDTYRDGYSSLDIDWSGIREQGGYAVGREDSNRGLGTRATLQPMNRSRRAQPAEPAFEQRHFIPIPPGVVRIHAREGLVAAYVAGDEILAGLGWSSEERLAAGLSQESTRFALCEMPRPTPLWLQNGMAWLVASTEISATRISFADATASLGKRRMPSLLKVLTQTEGMTAEETLLACAFTHYGLYGNNAKKAPKFIAFVERLQSEPMSERLFSEVFGTTVQKTEKELTDFVHSFAAFKSIQLNGRLPELPAIIVRDATQSEVARLTADALITQGEPDSALDVLRIAYWRGEREPEMLAVLAGLEERFGSVERAEKITKALMSLENPPARVFPAAARLLYRQTLATKKPGQNLTSAETKTILAPVGRAVQAGLNSEELCAFFSEVVLRSDGTPHSSIRSFLAQAAKRFPKNSVIHKAAAHSRQAGT